MPYKSTTCDRVHMTRWEGSASVDDLKKLMAEVEGLHASLGRQAVHISIVPQGFPPMPSDVRSHIVRETPVLFTHCVALYNVVEGTGFWASAMRGVFTGLVMAAGVRGRVFVEPSLQAAARHIREHYGVDADRIIAAARERGVAA
jgi:hypothetical protein